ncbi:hypothetical protein [Dietzia sp. CH92]|uniref:hypothetical protein n=1 Tax=Dietzia sp. CH92 TaxID=3051823 RepID=UPI0028D24B3D|nr:hypothetical protein [Dietzia sp. CH92]
MSRRTAGHGGAHEVSATGPRPAPVRRGGALAWLLARAFTGGRVAAALATPAALLILVPYLLRRAVYESDDRNGMVLFCRHRPVVDVVLVLVVGALLLTFGSLVELVLPDGWRGGLVFAGLVFGAVALGAVLMSRGMPLVDVVGPETPAGPRWALMGLAQRPGTRYSALLLTRRLLRGLRPGDVVVAAAADERLAEAYERFGFTRTRHRRVHRVIP